MKERFWFVYYWVMIAYLVSILINYYLYFSATPVPDFFEFIDDKLHFNSFKEYYYSRIGDSRIGGLLFDGINNYYPFLVVLLMTLIRFIAIKKHIWHIPETS